jgi:hypothetical protein
MCVKVNNAMLVWRYMEKTACFDCYSLVSWDARRKRIGTYVAEGEKESALTGRRKRSRRSRNTSTFEKSRIMSSAASPRALKGWAFNHAPNDRALESTAATDPAGPTAATAEDTSGLLLLLLLLLVLLLLLTVLPKYLLI